MVDSFIQRIDAYYGGARYGISRYGTVYTSTEQDDAYNSLLGLLNNPSYVEDPCQNRLGSFFVDSDFKLVSMKYSPLGQVVIVENKPEQSSYGRFPKRDKSITFDIHFYSADGITGSGQSATLKNKSLVHFYLGSIQDVIVNNISNLDLLHLPQFGVESEVKYIPQEKIYWGVLPVTFSMVKR